MIGTRSLKNEGTASLIFAKINLYIYTFKGDNDLKKILIIRFSSIGDIVLTSPVIRCLKEQLPDCEIHYLTKKDFSPLIEANPSIDKVFHIEKKLSEVIGKLKLENYHFVVDLHKNVRSAGVKHRLRRPYASIPKLNIKKWLLVNLKMNLMPDIHIVDRYFKACSKLKIINDKKGLDFFIPAEEEVGINTLLPDFSGGYYAWAIGGAHNTKMFPVDKIIEVIKKTDFPFIILGGKEDVERGEKIASSTNPSVYNACGKYSVNQSASIVKQSEKLITNDTGMMHIAAAFNKKIVSIWGNTVPAFGMYPYMPEHENRSKIIEIKHLSCRPCSKIGYSKCPKKHFNCMEEIDTGMLSEVIRNI